MAEVRNDVTYTENIRRNPYFNEFNVRIRVIELANGVSTRISYSVDDFNTKIEITPLPNGDLHLADFFSSYLDTLPSTPKGYGRRLLCAVLHYLLEINQTTLRSEVTLVALDSEPGTLENEKTLIHQIYYPLGLEVVHFYTPRLREEGGAKMRGTVQTIMEWCANNQPLVERNKSKRLFKRSKYDWRKSKRRYTQRRK